MPTLTITTIQANLHWEDKEANLHMFEDKIKNIKERTEIVVLPEMFSTGFSMKPELLAEKMDGPTVAWMKKMAMEKKIILTGSVIIEEEGRFFNRLIWMLPNGEHGYYDKRHLFAYAGEHEHYTGGKKRLIASVKGWKINLLVCYDLRFPVWSRQERFVKPPELESDTGQEAPSAGEVPKAPDSYRDGRGEAEYDMLIYVANWPERRIHAWKTMLQARAIENQCFVVGVNRVGNDGNNIYYSGDSMIVDALGEVMYSKSYEEDIFTITLQKAKLEEIRTRLPFLRDADDFHIEP